MVTVKEMLIALEIPACAVEGRLLVAGWLFKEKLDPPRQKKKTTRSDWVRDVKVAQILGISREDVISLVGDKKLEPAIHQGGLFVSLSSIDECKKTLLPKGKEKTGKVVQSKIFIIRNRPFNPNPPPKKNSRPTDIISIKLTEYSPGQFGYEVNDVAVALDKHISAIQSFISGFKVKAVLVGGKQYIKQQSLKDFLKKSRGAEVQDIQ